jgi:uncharacterized protein YeeX (DUF496 family)
MFGLSPIQIKMIIAGIVALLFIIVLLYLNPTDIVFVKEFFGTTNETKINCLNKKQAAEVFGNPAKFPIIKKFKEKETILRTCYEGSFYNISDLQNKALNYYKTRVQNFSQKEISYLTKKVAQLQKQINKFNEINNFKFPVMKQWNFIKLSKSMDWGYPYTIDKYIVLPSNFTEWENNSLVSTLFHEQFHIYQRMYPRQFEKFYDLFGFEKIKEPVIPKNITNRLVTNPDAPYIDYAFKLENNKYLVPFLMLNSLNLHTSRGLIYNKNKKGILILESSNLIDLKKYDYYYSKFYKSKQPYHPHEIFATVVQKFVFTGLKFTEQDTKLYRNFFNTNLILFQKL